MHREYDEQAPPRVRYRPAGLGGAVVSGPTPRAVRRPDDLAPPAPVGLLEDIVADAHALEPVVASVDLLTGALRRGDRRAAAMAAATLVEAGPLRLSYDTEPSPGVSRVMLAVVDAVEERWPDGTVPQLDRCVERVERRAGTVAADVLVVAVLWALRTGMWARDAGIVEGWLAGRPATEVLRRRHLDRPEPDSLSEGLEVVAATHGIALVDAVLAAGWVRLFLTDDPDPD